MATARRASSASGATPPLRFHSTSFYTLDGLKSPPDALERWPANYSSFNPSLLPLANGSHLAFFRVSNMHYCEPGSWRDRMAAQRHLRSYIAAATLESRIFRRKAILRAATELFRSEPCDDENQWLDAGGGAVGTFTGPEDPRAFWSPPSFPRAPWLLTSAWSRKCGRRLNMHLVKLPPSDADPSTPSSSSAAPAAASQLLLKIVGDWPKNGSSPACVGRACLWTGKGSTYLPHPKSEAIQKNWIPFVHEESLFAEYSIEPRAVLKIDASTGKCTLVTGDDPTSLPADADGGKGGSCAAGNRGESREGECSDDGDDGDDEAASSSSVFASFPPLARIHAAYGRVSGGAPPIHLPSKNIYLGLAHFKHSRLMENKIGTSEMVYRHLFYAFADRPPFAIVAAGTPFVLPEEEGRTPTVQFASGMALVPPQKSGGGGGDGVKGGDGEDVLVSYSTRDCGVRLTRVRLDEVLRDVGVVW